jgi:hypothetical protein
VGSAHIFVHADSRIVVLDANGEQSAKIDLPSDEWKPGLVLGDNVIAVYAGDRLAALAVTAGKAIWQCQFEYPIRAIHQSPSGDIFLWIIEETYVEHHGYLLRLDQDGRIIWKVPQVQKLLGLVRNHWLGVACDDGGNLYTVAFGRIGDGVSGNDRASGGLAAFSYEGVLLWACPNDEFQREVYGSATGAVFNGPYGHRCHAPDGTPLWHSRRGGRLIELPQLDISLHVDERLAEAPVLIWERENVQQVLRRTSDLEGNSYFCRSLSSLRSPPRYDLLVSVDANYRVRWSLPLPMIENCSPVLGPNQTILLACGTYVLAID